MKTVYFRSSRICHQEMTVSFVETHCFVRATEKNSFYTKENQKEMSQMPIIQTCIFGLLSAALLWGLKEDR